MKPKLLERVVTEGGRGGAVVGYDRGEYDIRIMDDNGNGFWVSSKELVTDHDCHLSEEDGCTHWSHPQI